MPIIKENLQKRFGLLLHRKLNFLAHINENIKKANKGISIIKKLNPHLPLSSFITIFKTFARHYLDYGDIIYDQPNNVNSLSDKIESGQYDASLSIIGDIKGT